MRCLILAILEEAYLLLSLPLNLFGIRKSGDYYHRKVKHDCRCRRIEKIDSKRGAIQNDSRENIRFWFEICTCAAAMVGICGVIWQGCVSTRQAQSAEQQLKEMREARIQDERAWVGTYIVNKMFTAVPGQDATAVRFSVPYKNTGKTPALNVVPFIGQYADIPSIPKSDRYPNPIYHSMNLPPSGEAITETATAGPVYEAIKGGSSFYIAGTFWYDDIFGKHHWTQFCYRIDSNFDALPQPVHNSCDDVDIVNGNGVVR